MLKTLVVALMPMLAATAALGCDWNTAQDAAAAPKMRLAQAQDTAKPARGPQSQVSVPEQAPPATTTNTTAATDQSPKVEQMNQNAASKVATEGK